MQFISNVLFARFVNKEPLTLFVGLATVVIVGGCVVLVVFGSHESPKYSAKQLQKFYSSPGYIAYLAAAGSACVIAYIVFRIGKRRVGCVAHSFTCVKPWMCMQSFSKILNYFFLQSTFMQ